MKKVYTLLIDLSTWYLSPVTQTIGTQGGYVKHFLCFRLQKSVIDKKLL